MAANHRTRPPSPTRTPKVRAPRDSLCLASLGAAEPAGTCFPLSMQADAMHPSSTHVLLPGEEDKAATGY